MRILRPSYKSSHSDTAGRLVVTRLAAGLSAAGLLAAMSLAPTLAAAAQPDAPGSHAKGRILVMPNPGLPDDEFDKIIGPHGGKARKISSTGLAIVDLPAGASEHAVAALLANNPHIKFAELDMAVAPSLATNDPYLGSAWHITKIGANAAWDTTQGSGVTIAILDTGVDGTHPDLVSQMVPGWNFYSNTSNTSDVKGHGTWVAGAAAATSNNGIGVAAVAGKAKIMPIRISDTSGTAYWSHIAQGITWAADHGARVANVSYEGLLQSSAIINAANYMRSKGGLVVIAAGNCSCNAGMTPSTSMISVSATDANDARASFSSYGSYVVMSAPGNYVYTTEMGNRYTQGIGTSFASPVVAATIALMMSAKPTMANTQIESLLFSTATDLGAAGRDSYFGYGRVNAAAAVQAVAGATVPPSDTTAPTATISNPLANVTVTGVVNAAVTASDNVGVTKVELRANGALVATDTTAPYSFSWDSTKVANGTATLTSVSYDAAGNSKASAPVSVNVSNTTALAPPPSTTTTDTIKPVVTISNPNNGTKLSGKTSVAITASASDNVAVTQQTLYIDDKAMATVTSASLSYTWNLTGIKKGPHYIKVVARDAANNITTATAKVNR